MERRRYVCDCTLVKNVNTFSFWSVDDDRERKESLQLLPSVDVDSEMVSCCTVSSERKQERGTDLAVDNAEVVAEELLCVVDGEVGREGRHVVQEAEQWNKRICYYQYIVPLLISVM